MNPAWEKALDLRGLLLALQCCDDTAMNDEIARDARAAVLNVAVSLADDLCKAVDGPPPTDATA